MVHQRIERKSVFVRSHMCNERETQEGVLRPRAWWWGDRSESLGVFQEICQDYKTDSSCVLRDSVQGGQEVAGKWRLRWRLLLGARSESARVLVLVQAENTLAFRLSCVMCVCFCFSQLCAPNSCLAALRRRYNEKKRVLRYVRGVSCIGLSAKGSRDEAI